MGVRQLALVPLATLRSRLGVLFVGREESQPLSDDDKMILTTVADHSALGIENLRLYRQLEQLYEKDQQRHELILDELEAARRLQLSLLPTSPPRHSGVLVDFEMRTASEVGGL